MYPTGHYGKGIRGLGDAFDLSMLGSDLIPFDAGVTSFLPYVAQAYGKGVADTPVSPTSQTNYSGSAPTTTTSKTPAQVWMANNGNTIVFVALAFLLITALKR
jgi:hypothetical protein